MTTPLYGGALVGSLPPNWIDASDLRPVPDNQEVCCRPLVRRHPCAFTALPSAQVWMERAGAERTLIVELMERPNVTDAECAALHFEELASGNDALRSAVVSSHQLAGKPSRLGSDPPCLSLCGYQALSAGEGAECQVQARAHTATVLLPPRRTTCMCAGAAACRAPRRVQDRPAGLDYPTRCQARRCRRQAHRLGGRDRCGRGARTLNPRQHRNQG